ncbi:MAG: 30S ribosomal protein S9 [Spirochaetales bacterium]|nr:30S ribosomal protein S9 [Spirochaetales bacterium]
MTKNLAQCVGRRKTSIARVILRDGKGEISVNKRALDIYFPDRIHRLTIIEPLDITSNANKFDIMVKVTGGGTSGQADAIRHGIARALAAYDASNTASLRASGMLTRDPRMVERKKFGRAGARKRFQFSKR